MVDYHSRYIEIAYVRTPTTQSVILKMKDVFARCGVPETIIPIMVHSLHHESFRHPRSWGLHRRGREWWCIS